jgi:N-acetylglucosaminyl-diphospho-decaprenol L-rhamnosyltransferase
MNHIDGLVSVSVVSHGQIALVQQLLNDFRQHCSATSIEVILTVNVEETISFDTNKFEYPVRVIRNSAPKGFAANHNAAFRQARGEFFCVINPDIRLAANPFPCLIGCLTDNAGVVAPLVVNPQGGVEDSARCFPTPWSILCKAVGEAGKPDYSIGELPIQPDWVGGMFMLFRNEVFRAVNGFDERYFLYYEDVDLCARLTLQNLAVLLCPQAKVIHEARRSSHRNLKYTQWHLRSMGRFFLSKPYRAIRMRKKFSAGKAV